MDKRRWVILASVAATSAAGGYFAASPPAQPPTVADAPRSMPDRATPAAATTQPSGAPVIAVAGDGNVTLHVDQQPLEWVLEQIAAQLGAATLTLPAPAPSAVAAAQAARTAETGCLEPPDPAREVSRAAILQAVERGAEGERADGLLQARAAGLTLPDTILQTLFETDASERVRLEAFESYLEARSGDLQATRDALQAALYVPSPAIQNEARQRLERQLELDRIDAASGQVSGP